ncbi:hypothetical protein [Rhizorhabdus sp. FW153]|uniref:hypothetical protein n=1 Tax=Rhizorhabdus sp. FW153 TaxID=3400216 RepID=UPI003CF77322
MLRVWDCAEKQCVTPAATKMHDDYFLCGWRVHSALPIPELVRWPAGDDRPPDIFVEEGVVPEWLGGAQRLSRYVMVDPAGTILLNIADRQRFLIEDGSRVTVDLMKREEPGSWHLFFLGIVLGYLCHQRGVFPLRAATLRVGGQAIVIAGASGAGKSTLAHALNQRGHPVLSDEITAIRDRHRHLEIVPAFPRLNLWRSALDAATISISGLPQLRGQIEKYAVEPQGGFDLRPLPPDTIVILGEATQASLTKLTPAFAFPAIQAYIPQQKVAAALGQHKRLFATTARIVSKAPIYRLLHPKRFEALQEVVSLVESVAG